MRKAKHTECYVDDCLTHSPDINGHLGDLRIALRCLEKAGIQLRRDKCKFGYNECEFLGHRISGEGRTPTQSYTERISKFPVPKSEAELKRFLGTVGYYRCYIPNLAAVASPLYSLTKKGTPFRWDRECEEEFGLIRQYLVQEQVTLKYPEWEKPFYIEADASALGVAAVLSQVYERTQVLRPICYHLQRWDWHKETIAPVNWRHGH